MGYYALASHKVARRRPEQDRARWAYRDPRRLAGPARVGRVIVRAGSRRGAGRRRAPTGRRRVPETVAARLVVVDALHERVARFYESLGFRRLPDSLLLVQKVSDIEAALSRPC